MFNWVTPELFDVLVLANLVLATGLAGVRFTLDMRRSPRELRQQQHDEISRTRIEREFEEFESDDTKPTRNRLEE